MPGKVNPVIPEIVNQDCFQVIGQDLTVTMAAEAGQLQLNAMEPVIGFNIVSSLRLLRNVVETFATLCVAGIRADEAQCRQHLDESTALATALIPAIGYDAAARLPRTACRPGERSASSTPSGAGGPTASKHWQTCRRVRAGYACAEPLQGGRNGRDT